MNELTDYKKSRLRSLQIFCYYRLLIAISLFATYIGRSKLGGFEVTQDRLYFTTTLVYLLVCTISTVIAHQRQAQFSQQAFFHACVDILALAFLMHASGGLSNSLPILMVVSVAAGNIIVVGRLATFIAALATLCVLYEQFYDSINATGSKGIELFQAGSLGIAFFATAFLTQQLAKRLRESEKLASQRGEDLAELEQLNHLVIQRMRTGIIALSDDGLINLVNDGAYGLLGKQNVSTGAPLDALSLDLKRALDAWQTNHDYRHPPFRSHPTAPEVICNFAQLDHGDHSGMLIFLEDQSQLAQQAQQMKLASLGTLTAGIAHEIRNPLGAISHAAQLLQESEVLTKGDARLADIIQQHSIRMNKIVENVLQLSRRKQSLAELITLAPFLETFTKDFLETCNANARINLRIQDASLRVRIDTDQLDQILTNLCQNGLRYSEKETGNPHIDLISGVLDDSDRPHIDIIDHGRGVTLEDAEHIFEPFFTTSSTGTGLGLYIAKELCEVNEARLDYIPIKSGSCFRITFPHPERISSLSTADHSE